MTTELLHIVFSACQYCAMQSFALTFAITLLGLGGFLNMLVIAFFTFRVLKSFVARRPQARVTPPAALAAAHR